MTEPDAILSLAKRTDGLVWLLVAFSPILAAAAISTWRYLSRRDAAEREVIRRHVERHYGEKEAGA